MAWGADTETHGGTDVNWVIIALASLLLVRGIFVRQSKRARWTVPVFVLVLVIGAGLTNVAMRRMGFVPDTDASRVAHQAILTLQESLEDRDIGTIIFVDGGSYGARGVNGLRLEQELERKSGKSVGVVQMTLAGANHFERYTLVRTVFDGLTSAELASLKKRRVILLLEINSGYDANPVNQLNAKNRFSERLYGYLTPDNVWYAIRAMHSRDAQNDWQADGEMVAHALMNFFNVGVRARMIRLGDVGFQTGHSPLQKASKGFTYRSVMSVLKARKPAAPIAEERWLDAIRTPRLQKVMRGTIDRIAYYAPPNLNGGYLAYAQVFCHSHPGDVCIDYADADLLRSLDHKNMWYDRGHLLAAGAVRYTDWLAGKIDQQLLREPTP